MEIARFGKVQRGADGVYVTKRDAGRAVRAHLQEEMRNNSKTRFPSTTRREHTIRCEETQKSQNNDKQAEKDFEVKKENER
ncbi:hypothetical protein BLNAU_3253 [Blattamonas nauphoetae]|uniref:Uncharacterized protein n=1 Tax=Blattamonas nauphoetae TaxID=2049346 RepID=A0ABQ9YDH7_9EUKA|nr:hypothetical protein BLNAU_3253 [Blattamonas nauphoetae]